MRLTVYNTITITPLGRFSMVDISTTVVWDSVGAKKVRVGDVSPRPF